ncbi:ribosomal protein S18-alanine N-acetyltransferase [Paenibacillus protaetiae]|uniref:Ribosomal-protein-alanine N-acetyltransferase n=1 Tax=Paenibacillus protaetiae TaxID=2509456 RepID=A0A4P6F1H2_9BACL|nr:ribosomal protein S18-alanine N-acetyltransferase [Paenibacillus protaetiae]QAY66887.1 ribosomal-protein-alanine N-acetyltransferase [Paenibacillus protaetiae]
MTGAERNVLFRPMVLADIPAVEEIEQEAFATPWTSDAFTNELTNNMFAKYIVMESGGELIGYGGMWVIVDEAHVTNVAIRSDCRGQGFGRLLMSELQHKAVFYGAERMTLEVRVSNTVAQNLYRKLGFEPSGVRPGYYSDNNEDALIMWAELERNIIA